VSSSFVEVSVTNNKSRTVSIRRDIKGYDNKVIVLENGVAQDYFLGSAGEIGSHKNDRGFHYWLERFIGWELPEVVTFEGKSISLYLECIFPLFLLNKNVDGLRFRQMCQIIL